MRGRAAMTVIEVVIAMAIGVLIGSVIYRYVSHSGRRYSMNIKKSEAQRDLRMCVRYLQSDLSHLRENQEAEPRYFRRELPNLFEVLNNRLTFATSRGEKISYSFEPVLFTLKRTVEPLEIEELTIQDMILKKVKERADSTFSMVTNEIKNQIDEKISGFKEVFNLGDPSNLANNPQALTQKCTEVFEKLEYYTGTDGADSGFVTDLQESITKRAEEMATEVGYGVESDAEEVMGTLLSRYFQLEDLAPPKMHQAIASEKIFEIKGSYRVILAENLEKLPTELSEEDRKKILGFRFFLESASPISSLEHFYRDKGITFIPNALVLKLENRKSQWNSNPPPRVKLKIMDLITTQELTGRYYGEAIIPDANILYQSWVEIPEFWFLDIFNTEEEVEKLRKGLINPDEAEPGR